MEMKQMAEDLGLYIEETGLEKAKNLAGQYDYVIAHMLSRMRHGTPDQVDVDWDELVELRAFGQKGELHVFGGPGELSAVLVREEGCREFLDKRYPMRDGNILKVREYFMPDEDGQAVVVYARPFAVVKEG